MAFNKRKHLLNNYTAVRTAFDIERSGQPATPEQRKLLLEFSGFGGLKCMAKPYEKEEDKERWNESEKDLFAPARAFYSMLKDMSQSPEEYKHYVDGIHSSMLSAFYTPPEITIVLADSLKRSGITPGRFLDPCAGTGEFIRAFDDNSGITTVAFEIDPLASKVLKALHPDKAILNTGFEATDDRHMNYFDVVASNIPFGDYAVFDPSFRQQDKARYQASKAIHSYFFVKALDMARQGGIVAFITSQGLMDSPKNESTRRLLMENANLVSAIRLPNNLFNENAGTTVGSDLIILQKNTGKKELNAREEAFIGTRSFYNGIHVNNYYMDFSHIVHTEAKVGKNPYGQPAMEFYHDGHITNIASDLSEKLNGDLNLFLNHNLYNKHKVEQAPEISAENSNKTEQEPLVSLYDLFGFSDSERTQINEKQNRKINTPANTVTASPQNFEELDDPMSTVIMTKEPRVYTRQMESFYKTNTLITDRGQIGYLSYKAEPGKEEKIAMFNPIDVNASQIARIRDYIPLRDAYLRLYGFESSYKVESPALRLDLNEQYQTFTGKNNDLNSRDNLRFILLDTHGREVLALESFSGGHKKLADIFEKPVTFNSEGELLTDKPDEALAASLNKFGEVNLDYMSSVSTLNREEFIDQLEGKIFYNPLIGNYEFSTAFVSGDVIEKADKIEAYISTNPGDENLEDSLKSLKVLRDATPKQIPFSELDFNFGERWIPTGYFSDYISGLYNTKVEIDYVADLDNFFYKAQNEHTIEIKESFSVTTADRRKLDGLNLLSYALINTSPNITRDQKVGADTIKVPDTEAIQLANSRIDEIRGGFMDWLSSQPPKVKDELQDMYNRKFNARVKPEYDGKFQTFPDLQLKALGIPRLYDSQYDAAWMLKSNDGGIVDHEVGTGKTLTICITAYEMKRLKMANKPMIIGLKSNVHELADTFSKAYPNARILFPSERDFEPENRKRLFNNIKNNNWDAIILTHDQFIKIPQSLDVQRRILQGELDSVTENLKVYERLQGHGATSGQIKGLEKRKKNLIAKLKDVQYRIDKRKDDVIDFNMMGIDHLFVDESHIFKNLTFNTRYNRVAGLGNPEGSQRAINLLFAIRTMQDKKDKDLCATFLSGTTISNSLVELYLLFKYLRPRALEAQGIRTFDAWAAVFAKKTTDFEFTVTNEIKQKERFRFFKNVPELGNFYNEITDFRTANQLKVDRPENIVTMKVIPATPEMEEFLPRLIQFANTKEGKLVDREPLTYEEEKAIGLIVTDYARKMSLDMRMIDAEKYTDHPNNKASQCAASVAEFYNRYKSQKGTQFIFSDLGTYKPDKWNVFSEIKRKLVEDYNIPAHEVRFINEAKNMDQRKAMINDMKEGKIRIMMGSTSKLGTGVNAQDKTVAGHNLDVPWKPSELRQRNGRYWRKGNQVAKEHADNKVHTILYASHNSLDTYKFNLLQNKDLFINQLKTNSLGVRSLDEGAMGEDGGMNFSEYIAIISGNTDMLEKVKTERQITVLQGELRAHNSNLSGTKWRLEESKTELAKKETRLEGMINDYKLLETKAPKNEEGIRANPIQLNGYPETDMETIGKRLNEINMTAETGGDYQKIGTLLDFNILVKTDRSFLSKYNHFYVEGACKYAYNNGNLATDPVKAATNFIKALNRIPELIESYKKDIDSLKKDIPPMEKILNTPWRKEKDLIDLKAKLDTLDRRIAESMKNNSRQVTINPQAKQQDPTVISIKPVMPTVNKPRTGIKM